MGNIADVHADVHADVYADVYAAPFGNWTQRLVMQIMHSFGTNGVRVFVIETVCVFVQHGLYFRRCVGRDELL
jgi:hypothetical protein